MFIFLRLYAGLCENIDHLSPAEARAGTEFGNLSPAETRAGTVLGNRSDSELNTNSR